MSTMHIVAEMIVTHEQRVDSRILSRNLLVEVKPSVYGNAQAHRLTRVATNVRHTLVGDVQPPQRRCAHQVFTRKLLKNGTVSSIEVTVRLARFDECNHNLVQELIEEIDGEVTALLDDAE